MPSVKIHTIGNMDFVYIATGTFIMGQPDPNIGFPGTSRDEQPLHQVTIDGFWMGRHEVTQKQYREIMNTDPCADSKYGKGDDYPVHYVNWHDAVKFCKLFSNRYKVTARLPYEAEWEYACRAGTSTRYYWGNKIKSNYCWYGDNSKGSAHPVGTTEVNANPWGLSDMIGNVYEWCFDWYDADFYSKSPAINPVCMKKDPGYHIVRGGSWDDHAWGENNSSHLRSSDRHEEHPDIGRRHNVGFRIVVLDNSGH